MSKAKPPKLTPSQKAALDKIARAGSMISECNPAPGEPVKYYTCKGTPIHRTTAESLIEKKLVIGAGDGLFGASQTYRVA